LAISEPFITFHEKICSTELSSLHFTVYAAHIQTIKFYALFQFIVKKIILVSYDPHNQYYPNSLLQRSCLRNVKRIFTFRKLLKFPNLEKKIVV
jgi:hypothetical protein